MKDKLTYYGWCRECRNLKAVEADVLIADLPDKCPECGGKLDFRMAAHKHPAKTKKKGIHTFIRNLVDTRTLGHHMDGCRASQELHSGGDECSNGKDVLHDTIRDYQIL